MKLSTKLIFYILFILILIANNVIAKNSKPNDKIWNKAISLLNQNRAIEAIPLFEKYTILEESAPSPDFYKLGVALVNIGYNYNEIGQTNKAYGIYSAVQQHLKRIKNKNAKESLQIALYSNIGQIHHELGEYDKALNYYETAAAAGQTIEAEDEYADQKAMSLATVFHNMGLLYNTWGKYPKAMKFHRLSLDFNIQTDDRESIANNLNTIGGIYMEINNFETAVKYFKRALIISKKHKFKSAESTTLQHMGVAYSDLGMLEKAIDHHKQAYEIEKQLKDTDGIASCYFNIGSIYFKKSDFSQALEYFEQALKIKQNSEYEYKSAHILSAIGDIYYIKKKYQNAVEYYNQSILIKENIRKTAQKDIRRNYLSAQISTYEGLICAYYNLNNPTGVYKSIEQSRARLLTERLGISTTRDNIGPPALTLVQQHLKKDEAILVYSNSQWFSNILMILTDSDVTLLDFDKTAFLDTIKSLYKKPIIKDIIQKKSSLLPPENSSHFPLRENVTKHSEFKNAIRYYRTSLIQSGTKGKRGIKHTNQIARLLFDLLIKPVETKLTGKKKLIISADGILNFLPFETLINENDQYLAHIFDISYIQSLTISNLLRKRKYKDNRKPMLAFGGAVYDKINYQSEMINNPGELKYLSSKISSSTKDRNSVRDSYPILGIAQWEDLPGTLTEVQTIGSIIENSEIITGKQVTENLVKAYSYSKRLGSYKVLHFATHGLVVPPVPELSAIVLSQFQNEIDGEDGYLRMGEIAQLDIKADFVNLSACETGLGKIYSGEGVVGLTESFLIAGANGLSVSLWQVADNSTSKFMTEMYKLVQKKQLTYSQAIAEVKRNFIRGDYGSKWQAPFFWAPFVYYGN